MHEFLSFGEGKKTVEQITEHALEKRRELHEVMLALGVPNTLYIQMCKDIIALFPEATTLVDRSEGRFSKVVKKSLIKKYGGCVVCGGNIVRGGRHAPVLEVHHILPREHGGDDSKENGILFCRTCHVRVHS